MIRGIHSVRGISVLLQDNPKYNPNMYPTVIISFLIFQLCGTMYS